jgi:hypothetical protein
MYSNSLLKKLRWSFPWLTRYPFWRLSEHLGRSSLSGPSHVVFLVANHFEPTGDPKGLRDLENWCAMARLTGKSIRDHDGTPFKHTNFYPAEQYDRRRVDMIAALQAEGFGEVEVHFHHGVETPDTAENTKRILLNFRDTLAEEHKCLSREKPSDQPRYAFVHGNWALANSAGGRFCGVDNEMQILADTGCYADFTLPSAPDESQVPRINTIYECGYPLSQARPHRSGASLRVGSRPSSPVIFTGPLVFDWSRRSKGLLIPRVDDGALAQNYPLTLSRFERWRNARISVVGRPEWIFIKLYCHGFFEWDQDAMIGEQLRRFMAEVLEYADKAGTLKIHFASAREAFNMVLAAVDGHTGDPNTYRNYRLREIMKEDASLSDCPKKETVSMWGESVIAS